MREIKFRVRVNGKLVYLPDKHYSLVFGDEVPKVLQFHRGTIIAEHLKDIRIQQFTGLHDKHGTPIYEGDVVSFKPYYVGDKIIEGGSGVIKFDNGSFYINHIVSPELCKEEIHNTKIEVIGNICETPELLTTRQTND